MDDGEASRHDVGLIAERVDMSYIAYRIREYPDRIEYYDEEGALHRDHGPAVEYVAGHRFWYWYGILHRTDGPAVEYINSNGEPGGSWWLHGTCFTKKEYDAEIAGEYPGMCAEVKQALKRYNTKSM